MYIRRSVKCCAYVLSGRRESYPDVSLKSFSKVVKALENQ